MSQAAAKILHSKLCRRLQAERQPSVFQVVGLKYRAQPMFYASRTHLVCKQVPKGGKRRRRQVLGGIESSTMQTYSSHIIAKAFLRRGTTLQ